MNYQKQTMIIRVIFLTLVASLAIILNIAGYREGLFEGLLSTWFSALVLALLYFMTMD